MGFSFALLKNKIVLSDSNEIALLRSQRRKNEIIMRGKRVLMRCLRGSFLVVWLYE